ncbi:polysaccharide pyruvyl transferase family protein [Gelidibacter japonicus]|uniref:polysaccharide pyruvyl transferase family protein n=1 Tax=Gelidibacter japonicus TaxID=1962232 RepID=UPI003A8E1B7B
MIKIAHFGTFDVDNYGDLLFPHIAEYRLPHYKWEHVSPTNNITVFKDGMPIIPFECAREKQFDCILIGGGNILHLNHNQNTVYNKIEGFAYADLWVGAAKIAMEQKIPYIFNAPGVSRNFVDYLHKRIALATFKNSNYIALRERISVEMAESISTIKTKFNWSANVVPDTAFDIDKMWPLDIYKSTEYISVNLNERYHKPIDDTAENLDEISKELKMPIKLIIIGNCHGDYEFTKKVSNRMQAEHQVVESDSLKKVAHLIGNSNYFFGSSMHGFITALSYNVPAFLILNKTPLHKFTGLLEITEIDDKVICESFKDVRNVLNFPAILDIEVRKKIQSDLDKHWRKIDHIIKNEKIVGVSKTVHNFHKLLKFQLKYNRLRNWI